jgi:hypothetical protein
MSDLFKTTSAGISITNTGSQLLILDFEGEDGAESWVEEAQGLLPESLSGGYLDTTTHYSGGSSLRLEPNGSLAYHIPGINGDFKYSYYTMYENVGEGNNGANVYFYNIILKKATVDDPKLGLGTYLPYSPTEYPQNYVNFVYAHDSDGEFMDKQYHSIIIPAYRTWIRREVIVRNQTVTVKEDGVVIAEANSNALFPFTGVDTLVFENNATVNVWFDKVRIRTL